MPWPIRSTVRPVTARAVLLASLVSLASLTAPRPSSACSPILLFARDSGGDVLLEWFGDPPAQGSTWQVRRGTIGSLESGNPDDMPVASELIQPSFVDPQPSGSYYYKVDCVLDGSPQASSNMAFRLERTFTTQPGFENLYFVSVPLLPGIPDAANSMAPGTNKCVGDQDGPQAGDMNLTADDLLCSWFTSRQECCRSGMVIARVGPDRNMFDHRGMLYEDFTLEGVPGYAFAGPFMGPIGPEGLAVNVGAGTGTLLGNSVAIVGAHDPNWPGQPIEPVSAMQGARILLNVPYHSIYREADEILCGLEGEIWQDADENGQPDTCPSGIFDGAHPMTVCTFDNLPSGGPTVDDAFTCRTVSGTAASPVVTGTGFALKPGEAYVAHVSPGHYPTTFLPPTY